MGGQKTLRTYWKNYFEKTDTLIWVVDSTDAARLVDCREELMKLLQEEVSWFLKDKDAKRLDPNPWNSIAVDGRKSARFQEQERCTRMLERG